MRKNTAIFTLKRLYRFRHLPEHIQLHLFNSLVKPQIMFSPTPLIYPVNRYGLEHVQKLQNKALRQIYKIPWDAFMSNQTIHDTYNIPTVSANICSRFNAAFFRLANKNIPSFSTLREGAHIQHRL